MHSSGREEAKGVSINGSCCLERLEQSVRPTLQYFETKLRYMGMPDDSPPHCTKEFLVNKFRNRVISHGTAINWSAYYPDLNPLDFSFRGEAQNKACRYRPKNIEGLIDCVKSFAASYEAE